MTKTKRLKIFFLDILTDDKETKKRLQEEIYNGETYAKHMQNMFGTKNAKFISVDAAHDKLPANPSNFDAIVIGGSTHDPVDGNESKWFAKIYRFINKAIKNDVPILGICGGLQFTVRALGGSVVYNPNGREFGTVKISLTKNGSRDLLFNGVPITTSAQVSHKCMAKNLKLNWNLLASSKMCGIQAIAIGDKIRLLQFHPEMTASQVKIMAISRKNVLLKEGFVKNAKGFNALIKSISSTNKTGKQILKNFIKYFVLPHHHSKS